MYLETYSFTHCWGSIPYFPKKIWRHRGKPSTINGHIAHNEKIVTQVSDNSSLDNQGDTKKVTAEIHQLILQIRISNLSSRKSGTDPKIPFNRARIPKKIIILYLCLAEYNIHIFLQMSSKIKMTALSRQPFSRKYLII